MNRRSGRSGTKRGISERGKSASSGEAPESGEPSETGWSGGHPIDREGAPAGRPSGGRKDRTAPEDSPVEAPESGRQDAVD